jgi:hypothetical protein
MKAVTVQRPWSWAIAQGSKDIENRSNRLRCVPLGGIMAIHAGKGIDQNGFDIISSIEPAGNMPPDVCATGIVAIARFGANDRG